MVKTKYIAIILMLILASCKNVEKNQISNLERKESVDPRLVGLKNRVRILETRASNRKEYIIARNKARKEFDLRLTEEEKVVIDKIRQTYLSRFDLIDDYFQDELKEQKDSIDKYPERYELELKIRELQMNEWRNYIIDLNDMLPIIVGEMKEEIYNLSNKRKAMGLFSFDKKTEALAAFRRAFDRNPQHFYLAQYIKHLEFVLDPNNTMALKNMKTYEGSYGNRHIWFEHDNIYYERKGQVGKQRLLPVSTDLFYFWGGFQFQMQVVVEDGEVQGTVSWEYDEASGEFVRDDNDYLEFDKLKN